jgi:Glycine-zipper domain
MFTRSKCSLLNRWFKRQLAIVTLFIGLIPAVASAQGTNLSVYPSNGQTPEQQARDKQECSQWAAAQTGPNSGMPAPPTATTASPPRGQVVRGGARGAAVGAVGGAVAGDAGTGAAAGAAMGATAGVIRRRQAKRQVRQQQANTQVAASSSQDGYNRALATCLQGRGYTVN